jgi:hypothetical protein
MGRVSKEFKNLTKNVSQFLTEQETTQKNLKACRRVLESILKSRASEKKKRYKQQLDNMFKNLCVGLDTNEKLQKQLDESRKENARLRQKKNEWHDKYLRLQTKTSKS